MKFQIEKFRREFDESGLYYRDIWDDLGVDDVLVDSNTRSIMVGCKESGLHMFLHDMLSFNISYHYIEIIGEDYKLRLSVPIRNGSSSNNKNNYNNVNGDCDGS